ncbi:MAG: hypothetical protein M0R68_12455 [Bacteroidetes bacterium]|nr:hypothetical protein [Bacteroidota bacterium]
MRSFGLHLLVILITMIGTSSGQSKGTLELLGTYKTGSYNIGSAEIVAHDPSTQRLYVIRGNLDTLDIVSIANPKIPVRVKHVTYRAHFPSAAGANSVAVRNGIDAVAVGDSATVNPQQHIRQQQHQ